MSEPVTVPTPSLMAVCRATKYQRFMIYMSDNPSFAFEGDEIKTAYQPQEIMEALGNDSAALSELWEAWASNHRELAIDRGEFTPWTLFRVINSQREALACATPVKFPVLTKTAQSNTIAHDFLYVIEDDDTLDTVHDNPRYRAELLSALGPAMSGRHRLTTLPKGLGSIIPTDKPAQATEGWDSTDPRLNMEIRWPLGPGASSPGSKDQGVGERLRLRWLYDTHMDTVARLQAADDLRTLSAAQPGPDETMVMFDASDPDMLVRSLDMRSNGDGNALRFERAHETDPIRGVYFTVDGPTSGQIRPDTPLFLFGHDNAHDDPHDAMAPSFNTVSVTLSRGVTKDNLPVIMPQMATVLRQQGLETVRIPGVDPEAGSTKAWIENGAELSSRAETRSKARGFAWYGSTEKYTVLGCQGWVLD